MPPDQRSSTSILSRASGPAVLLVLGTIHALSFSPDPLPQWLLPFIQIFGLAFLAHHVFLARRMRDAAAGAFLFCFANFAVGMYWLYISMHDYGAMAAPLAIAAVAVLAAIMALYGTLACAASWWLGAKYLDARASYQRHLLLAATFASCWTAAEWLRGTLFTGLPWLNIGYAHVEGMLAPWAPIIGVYGVAWLAAFASGAIGLLALARNSSNDARAAVGVGIAILTGLIGIFLHHVQWAQPQGKPLIVRLVQGNVPQSEKFDPGLMVQGQIDYLSLAELAPRAPDGKPDIIVLPETVVPLFQDDVAPELWDRWLDVARMQDASLILGVPLHDYVQGRERFTNSVIGVNANTPRQAIIDANPAMRYDKHHLVPFGEFVPAGFRWFVDAMTIPLGDFDRGPVRQRLFTIDGTVFAPNICYEDVFGEQIIASVRDSDRLGPGANVLVNVSNLAWFGDSWALRQHLQISRMRALETARPMLRATNTGMTAAIDPDGSIRAVLDPLQKGVLDVEVQGMTGITPYVRWGDRLALGWTVLFLILALALRRRPLTGDEQHNKG
ncbi:apolipoprotein N-acyltransferase [Allopusillimonas soli]|uniref:Apolipoprotein N-acyltransferase n=1 Tax=Allopusillimonas soli TaxID=659016 RepID=A0A853FGS3_9BURK|nr:apolipoprotein N-acyltransferase [Allopusillimonas soli]NYT38842.1 apolipoprotein N-acyltransferase [Allopusillimonas soli]TEA70281.1 apolipoprotein N-acyltransferase [Allopusillimonas soli]